jgi:hypothetical protein
MSSNGATRSVPTRLSSASSVQWPLPGKLSRQAFERMLRVLELDGADDRMIFEMLYEDHESEWEVLRDDTCAEAVHLVESLWDLDRAAQRWGPPGSAAVRRASSAIEAAANEIAALDARFFESVAALLPEGTARRLVHLIAMRTHERLELGYGIPGPVHIPPAALVFLPTIIVTADVDAELLDELDGMLVAYETAFLDSLVLQRKNHFEHRSRLEMISNEWHELRNKGDDVRHMHERQREAREAAQEDFTNLADDLAELNRATIARLLANLEGTEMIVIDRAWKLAAMPIEYADGNAVHDELRRTLELDDLTPEQHIAVSTLTSDYGTAYDGLCADMRRLREESPQGTLRISYTLPRDDAIEVRRRVDEIARLRFHRDEQSDLTRYRLRSLLDPEQRRRAGVVGSGDSG